MYKITKGDREEHANTYPEAEKKFNRLCKNKYPCGALTRLYCDLGDGYQLMRIGGKRIERALLPDIHDLRVAHWKRWATWRT